MYTWSIHVNKCLFFSCYSFIIRGGGDSANNSERCCCYCSVTQLCLTLCDPMDCSIPGFPVLHHLPDFVQLMSIELVMPSNHLILCCPLLLPPSVFASIRVFSNEKGRQRENDFSSLTKSSLVRPLHNTSYTSLSPNPYEDTEENFQRNLVYPGNCRRRMLPAISVNKGCCNHQ